MNAGEINIAVTASMDRFQATMNAVKAESQQTASQAGGFFKNKFFSELGAKQGNKIGEMLGAAVGIGMADQMVRKIADAMKNDKSIGEAMLESIRALPLVGSMFSLGEALEARMSGRMQDEAEARAANQAARELQAQYDKEDEERRKRIADREKEVEDSKRNQVSLERQIADIAMAREIASLEAVGDKDLVARLNAEKSLVDARRKFEDDFNKAKTVEEQKLLYARHDLEKKLISDTLEAQLDAIAEDAQKKQQEDKKRAAALAEQVDEERKKAMEDRETLLQQGVQSASTGIGAYRFDAYPATMKKMIDENMLRTLREISAKLTGGVTAGFA